MSSNLNDFEEKLDPRVKRTRHLILTSFESLLAEKPFESISVQDVTDKAEINRATFYAHFPDKYALLDYAVQKIFMAKIEERGLNMCSYSSDNLRNLMLVVCHFLIRMQIGFGQPHQQFDSLVEGIIKKHLFDVLSHWLRNSKLATEIPATVATWAIYGLASHYSHLKKRPGLENFVDQALPLVAVNLEQFA